MSVPFFRPSIGEKEITAAMDVLRSGWLTTGPLCQEFEEDFAEFLGGGVEAVAVNSATAGLHLAAEACGIGPGDEILAPTLTFTASVAAFRHLGAEPVLVDVDPRTLVIDLADAERKVTPRCKAIVVVHFGGWPCDVEAIRAFAVRHGLRVIEDCAHALPARRGSRQIGASDSDACVFSFYANKTITTGEGGMLVTRNPDIARRARIMRMHGFDRDSFDRFKRIGASWSYDVVAAGFKYNLTDLAAAIGIAQLRRAHAFRQQREALAEAYLTELQGLPLHLPVRAPVDSLHAWHLFPVRVRDDARCGRDELIVRLNKAGIGVSVHYRPLHQMTYWRGRAGAAGKFPNADWYFDGALTLPLFPEMTEAHTAEVVSVLKDALG
jgi:dTDP-4-amino-4,6-dideoxygalactose transaminase